MISSKLVSLLPTLGTQSTTGILTTTTTAETTTTFPQISTETVSDITIPHSSITTTFITSSHLDNDTTTAGITAATSMPVEPFAGLSGYLFSMHCMLFILERKQNSRFVSQK